MFDILAQMGETAAVGGLAGLGGAGVGYLVVKQIITRQVSKVLDHVDNNTIHLPPGNNIVKEVTCAARHEMVNKQLEEINGLLKVIITKLP